MSKLKTAFLLFLMTIFYSFSQNNKNDSTFIYIEKGTKYVEYFFTKDSTKADFCIYLQGYETKEQRKAHIDSIRILHKKMVPVNLKEFCIRMLCVEQSREKIKSIDRIKFITPDQYRKGKYHRQYMYVIYKIGEGCYLKWRIFLDGTA